jgi:APA family basic amino acid/polyamine antiporter
MPKPPNTQPALKRSVGLVLFVLYGVGNIIGAGIYVLVGKVAGEAGMQMPFAFVLAALIAGASGLSYGELGARYPLSAGEAVYLYRAFRLRSLSVAVGLLMALAGLVSAATLARGFVGYFNVFFAAPPWLVVLVVVAGLTLIALRGIAESARVAAVLTLVEVGGLLWVIAVSSPSLGNLGALAAADLLPTTVPAWQGVLGGVFLAFFAFIGFEDMVNIAEEVKHPQTTIPRGIVLAFVLSTALYVMVAVVALATVPPAALAASDAPLADVYRLATGRSPTVISAIGLIAVINGALIQIIMASRIFYGMSSNGWLPNFLSHVNPRTHTPVRATLVAGAVALSFALFLPLLSLAKTTSALVLAVFVTINLSLLRIKHSEPAPVGVRPGPVAVPVIGALASAFILLSSIWTELAG